MGRTQLGNNNAYCQDDEVSWVHWDLDAADRRLLEFARGCIRIFQSNPVLRRRSFFTGGRGPADGVKDLTWVRPDGQEMTDADWGDEGSHVLGMLVHGRATDEVDERGRPIYGDTLLLLLNGGNRSRFFALPSLAEGPGVWQELVNTARPEMAPRAVRTPGVNVVAHSLLLVRFANDPTTPVP
jgi:glycogen operon protein